MSNPFRSGAAKWSSTAFQVSDEPVPASPRRGPSLLFALTVIVAVAGATAGAVAMFFVDPSESAPDATQAIAAAPAEPDAVVAAAPAVPVHKVTTQAVKAQADASADKQDKVQTADVASADDDELTQQDPRWARSGSEKTATVFASVLQSPTGAADKPAAGEDKTATETGALALAEEAPSEAADKADETRTAALAPDDVKPKQAAKPEQPEEKTKQAAVDDEVQDTAPVTGTTQIIKGANMRSRPKSGSKVLGIVPKGATVQLVDCDAWCEIVYKGRRGYVYKDFIAGGRSAKAAAGKVKSSFTVSTSEPEADQPTQDDKTAAAAGSKADEKPRGIISPRAQ